jgi:hypothetical protein
VRLGADDGLVHELTSKAGRTSLLRDRAEPDAWGRGLAQDDSRDEADASIARFEPMGAHFTPQIGIIRAIPAGCQPTRDLVALAAWGTAN